MRLTLLVVGLLACGASGGAQTTTIDNVTIVDVTTGRLQPRKTIVIEGNRIARIDNASASTHAAATLDGTGMFVIPGLWDMHVHAYFTNDTARFHSTSEVMFPLFVVNGITGVRDLGSNLDATLAARDSIAAHQLIGPRMLVSGPMLDGPTTRYAAAIKVANDSEARAAVRMLKQRGVDMIKTQSLIPGKPISRLLMKRRASAFPSKDTCRMRSRGWRRSPRGSGASSICSACATRRRRSSRSSPASTCGSVHGGQQRRDRRRSHE